MKGTKKPEKPTRCYVCPARRPLRLVYVWSLDAYRCMDCGALYLAGTPGAAPARDFRFAHRIFSRDEWEKKEGEVR